MNLKTETKYEIILKDETTIKGTLVSITNDAIFLKLESGYNQGILKQKIKKTKELETTKNTKTIKTPKITKKPEIMILHTGGTIASKVDYSTGAVASIITPEELITLYRELEEENIGSELISNMESDNMNFSYYNLIIQKIEETIKKNPELKGIILTHGTDTIHYTSAALSFALKNPPCPIILVGSQRSSDRPSSDASSNLLNAIHFIKQKTKYKQVMICMHSTTNDPESYILTGVNARKMHSSARDAFKQINDEPIATVNYETKKITINKRPTKNKDEKFTTKKYKENLKIGWIKSRPGMRAEEFDTYKDYDAIILEGTGLGHFPIIESDEHTKENTKIYEKIKQLSKKTTLIMTTQTIYGRVNMNVYSPGRNLKELGILGHNNATSQETTYIKIAYILSNHEKEIQKKFETNICGEIIERTKK